MFASFHSSGEINQEDFLELYYLIKVVKPSIKKTAENNKRAHLYFYVCKMHETPRKNNQQTPKPRGDLLDSFPAKIIMRMFIDYFELNENEAIQFLIVNKIDP